MDKTAQPAAHVDEEIIHEKGVLRLSARQVSMLWLELTDKVDVADIIDLQQPENFTDDISWSLYRAGDEATPPRHPPPEQK